MTNEGGRIMIKREEIPPEILEKKKVVPVPTTAVELTPPQQGEVLDIKKKVEITADRLKELKERFEHKEPEKIGLGRPVVDIKLEFTYIMPETGAKIALTYTDLEGVGISREKFAKIPEGELNKIALAIPSKDEAEFKELFLAGLSKWEPKKEGAEVITEVIILSPEEISNFKKAGENLDKVALNFGGTKTEEKPEEKPVAGEIPKDKLPIMRDEMTSIKNDFDRDVKDKFGSFVSGLSPGIDTVSTEIDKTLVYIDISETEGLIAMASDSLKTVKDTMLAMAEKEKKKKV